MKFNPAPFFPYFPGKNPVKLRDSAYDECNTFVTPHTIPLYIIDMNTVVLVINHIHFPYNLFEDALEWAKEHESRFRAVFLTNDAIFVADGEIFNETEPHADITGPVLAESGNQEIINEYVKFMQQRAKVCRIFFSSVIIVKPSIEQVVRQIRYADKIFIEFQNSNDLKLFDFTWDDILHSIPMHRQVISNKSYH